MEVTQHCEVYTIWDYLCIKKAFFSNKKQIVFASAHKCTLGLLFELIAKVYIIYERA